MELLTPDFGLLLWGIFTVCSIILVIIALIDLLRNHFANNDKLVWTIVVIFVLIIGPILYFTIGRRQKI